MQRYFLSSHQISSKTLFLDGGDVHHIKNVMRMSRGDAIEAVDENGVIYHCVISAFEKDRVLCEIVERKESSQKRLHLHLAQALIRKERFEWILEKATELHVEKIIPTLFERCVVKTSDHESTKAQRHRMIVKEAAEQSHRDVLPIISTPLKLKDLPFSDYDFVLVCYEKEDLSHHLNQVLPNISENHKVLILIGPEGGISESEITYLQSVHAQFVSLGELILRSETAGLYVLSAFLSKWGI